MAKLIAAGSAPEREGASTPARLKAAREKSARRRAVAAAAACYVIVLALLASGYYFAPHPDQAGAVPPADIETPVELRVVDDAATEARRDYVNASFPAIWRLDTDAPSAALQKLSAFFEAMRASQPQNSQQLAEFQRRIADQTGIALDASAASELTPQRLRGLADPLTLDYLQRQLELALATIYNEMHIVHELGLYQAPYSAGRLLVVDQDDNPRPVPPDAQQVLRWPDGVESHLLNRALPALLSGSAKDALRQAAAELLLQAIGGPDLELDAVRTEANHMRQVDAVAASPSFKVFKPGEVVAEEDIPLTKLQAEALAMLNERRQATMLSSLTGLMLFTAIVMAVTGLFLVRFRQNFRVDASSVFVHAAPIVLALAFGAASKIILRDSELVMLCFPAALTGLLSTLAINARAGFVMVLISACLFGLANNFGIDFMVLALMGGFSTVLTSRRLRERADLIQVAWKVGLVNMAVVAILTFIGGSWQVDWVHLAIVFANAVLSVGASLFIIRFFERVFGIVTDLRLLELTGLRHPLIVQLEEKAPGSYQHVLNVMKLAEAAAHAIGANYLLVRAGALFHDIGKMVKPKYFSENQVTLDDKKAHSRLSPYMSVLIIKNHVKEGVDLGKRFGLPQAIVDFIPQHHGNGLIRYFYGAAMKRYEESATAEPVREEDFRYPGPRPQSIEAAIVLLADSVEAIAASKFTGGQVSEDEIRRLAQAAISERFNDGQFDECDLTMRHLRDMREAFVRTLMARYHFRIAYPALPKPVARAEQTGSSIAIAGPAMRGEAG